MLKRMPLALRLSLALALAVALATVLVAVTVRWAAIRGFDGYLALETRLRTDTLRGLLEEHYAQQGAWHGIEPLLAGRMAGSRGMGMGPGMAPGTTHLLLVDGAGRVRYDPTMMYMGRVVSARVLRSGVPLEVNGQTVGYLVTRGGVQERALQRRLLFVILGAGGAAALVATGLGLGLVRTALRPLKELETATEQLAAGDLGVRVQVRANDEVGDVAQRFNSMAADLQRQDRLRRRLMNDLAHELRTPLTVMQGELEALQDGVFPLNQENLQPIYDQTLLLKRLVNDMRDLALAEAGHVTLECAPMDAEALLQRVAARFVPEAESRGVALRIAPMTGLPAVYADAQRMEQVFGNLLSNALRYTQPGGSVTISAGATASHLRITVQDTGEGIAPEDLAHLFERFYRSDRARQRGDGHSGLGLAIARELTRAHGGEITVESALGVGTTVYVELPIPHAAQRSG